MKRFTISLTVFLFLFVAGVFLAPSKASAATLNFSPSSGTYGRGSTLKVNINVNTGGEGVNAVQANFSYPTDKLQFSSISTGGSALSIIAEKSAGGGFVKVAGGNPSPFSGSKFIAAIYFKVLASSGSASLSFAQDSAVVRASDNQNVLTGTATASFGFSEKVVEPTPTEVEEGEIPKISEVRVEEIGKNSATISWGTDINSTSVVEYGLSASYGLLASSDELVTEHEIELPQAMLLPGTTYHFKVIVRSEGGREASSQDFSFTTKGYKVIINVTNNEGRPISGAEITLYTEPRKGVTDKQGKVEFADVAPGKHGLIVRYKGATEIKEIEVAERDLPQTFEVRLTIARISGTQLIYVVLGVLLLVGLLTLALYYFLKFQKKSSSL